MKNIIKIELSMLTDVNPIKYTAPSDKIYEFFIRKANVTSNKLGFFFLALLNTSSRLIENLLLLEFFRSNSICRFFCIILICRLKRKKNVKEIKYSIEYVTAGAGMIHVGVIDINALL